MRDKRCQCPMLLLCATAGGHPPAVIQEATASIITNTQPTCLASITLCLSRVERCVCNCAVLTQLQAGRQQQSSKAHVSVLVSNAHVAHRLCAMPLINESQANPKTSRSHPAPTNRLHIHLEIAFWPCGIVCAHRLKNFVQQQQQQQNAQQLLFWLCACACLIRVFVSPLLIVLWACSVVSVRNCQQHKNLQPVCLSL